MTARVPLLRLAAQTLPVCVFTLTALSISAAESAANLSNGITTRELAGNIRREMSSAVVEKPEASALVVPPGMLDFAVYATASNCGAVRMSGTALVDSFDSSRGAFDPTTTQGKAAVGTSGNVLLQGQAIINGWVFSPAAGTGTCTNGSPALSLDGKARATDGTIRLTRLPSFPTPSPVSAGTQDINVIAETKLAPGSYGNIRVTAGAKLSLAAGAYSIQSLALAGQSKISVGTDGPVIINIAGGASSEARNRINSVLDLTGGTVVNESKLPANLQILYPGSASISLSGGTAAFGLLYAPDADVTLAGGGDWFGSIVAKTFDNTGGSSLHYDRSLAISPTITGAVAPAPNSLQWNNTPVTVTFTCTDTIVGITSCTDPVQVTAEGGNQRVTGTATNRLGLLSTATVVVNIDKTLPTLGSTVLPAPTASGWYNMAVNVAFTCSDALSGIAFCSPSVTVVTEGATQPLTGVARDKADNQANATLTLSIDRTPPTIASNITPNPNTTGWTNIPTTVTFACSDSISSVETCTSAALVDKETSGQTIAGMAKDKAGNVASASATVKLDVTPPVLTITTPQDNSIVNSQQLVVTGIVRDALSGLATATCNSSAVSIAAETGAFSCNLQLTAGSNRVVLTATDLAGNVSTKSLTITYASNRAPSAQNDTYNSVGRENTIVVPNGFTARILYSGAPFTGLNAVTVDPAGQLVLGNIDSVSGLYRYALSSKSVTTLASGLPFSSIGQIRFGDGRKLVGTDLVVSDWNSEETDRCCRGRVFRVNARTAARIVVAKPPFPNVSIGDPYGLAFGTGSFGDYLYVMDFEGVSPDLPVLFRIDSEGAITTFARNPALWTTAQSPQFLALSTDARYGNYIYVSDPGAVPAIWRVDASGSITSFRSGALIGVPGALVFGPGGVFGSDLYFLDQSLPRSLKRISPDGTVETFIGNLPDGSDFAFAPDGHSIYIVGGDKIIEITTGTGPAPLMVAAPGVLSNDSDPDGDKLSAVLATTAAKGTLSLSTNGGFTYEPSVGYVGMDTFAYKASDGITESSNATVTLAVSSLPPNNQPPLAIRGATSHAQQQRGWMRSNTDSPPDRRGGFSLDIPF